MVPHSLLREACLQRLLPSGGCAWESYSLHSEDRWKRLKNDAHRNIETIRNGQTSPLTVQASTCFVHEVCKGEPGGSVGCGILADIGWIQLVKRSCLLFRQIPHRLTWAPRIWKWNWKKAENWEAGFPGSFETWLSWLHVLLSWSTRTIMFCTNRTLLWNPLFPFQNILVESCGIWCFK